MWQNSAQVALLASFVGVALPWRGKEDARELGLSTSSGECVGARARKVRKRGAVGFGSLCRRSIGWSPWSLERPEVRGEGRPRCRSGMGARVSDLDEHCCRLRDRRPKNRRPREHRRRLHHSSSNSERGAPVSGRKSERPSLRAPGRLLDRPLQGAWTFEMLRSPPSVLEDAGYRVADELVFAQVCGRSSWSRYFGQQSFRDEGCATSRKAGRVCPYRPTPADIRPTSPKIRPNPGQHRQKLGREQFRRSRPVLTKLRACSTDVDHT